MRYSFIILSYIGHKLSVFRQRRFFWIKKYLYLSVSNELYHDKTSQKYLHKESRGFSSGCTNVGKMGPKFWFVTKCIFWEID